MLNGGANICKDWKHEQIMYLLNLWEDEVGEGGRDRILQGHVNILGREIKHWLL